MSSLTKTELIDNSTTSLALDAQYICNKTPVSRDAFKHLLYPIKQLPAFRTALQASSDDDKRIAQYVVTNEKKLLIAREGTPSASTPGHRDMSHGPVIAAGHIFFNAAGDVVGLSNESDDFEELTVHSMLWPVLILHLTNTPLATPFIIIPSIIDKHGFNTPGEFELTRADRIQLADKLAPSLSQALLETNQDDVIITREHGSKKHHLSQANAPMSSNREIFFPFKKQQKTNHDVGLTAIECGIGG